MYYFYWTDANGKKHKKSLRTRSKAKAMDNAAELDKAVMAKDKVEVLHQAAKARQIIRQRDLPLSDVWGAFLKTKPTCADGTKVNHKRHLGRFVEWLEGTYAAVESFTQVNPDIAQEYAAGLWGGGMAAATFNYHRASLHYITATLAQTYGIAENPWSTVERKSDEQQTRRKLSTKQVQDLLKLLDTRYIATPEYRALFLLGVFAGMRLKDAALLQWSSVDMNRNQITYRPFKTRRRNKTAVVPMAPILRAALAALPRENGYAMPAVAKQYTDHNDTFKKECITVIRTVAKDTDEEGDETGPQHVQTRGAYGFHSLRRTFCSQCAQKGVPLAQLSLMTGDQMKTLDKYYIEAESDHEPIADAFQEWLPVEPAKLAVAEPERDELHKLVDTWPIERVRHLLKEANRSESPMLQLPI